MQEVVTIQFNPDDLQGFIYECYESLKNEQGMDDFAIHEKASAYTHILIESFREAGCPAEMAVVACFTFLATMYGFNAFLDAFADQPKEKEVKEHGDD